jgi:hypothetical protein
MPTILKIDTFHEINTAPKAYWIGFLGADGSNKRFQHPPPKNPTHPNCKYPEGRIQYQSGIPNLNAVDKEQVENFKEFIGPRTKANLVWQMGNTGFGGKYVDTLFVGFLVGGKMLSEDLEKNGVPPNKTRVHEYPTEEQVPNEFLRELTRGYFDGDGTIHNYQKKRHDGKPLKHKTWGVGILGTEIYVKALGKKLKESLPELSFSFVQEKRVKHRMFDLRIQERRSILMFLKWLYEGSTEKTMLRRKSEKAMVCIEELERAEKDIEEFGNLELIVSDPKGKIYKVKEKDWFIFAMNKIKAKSMQQSRNLRRGCQKAIHGRNKYQGKDKSKSKGWTILNVKEANERKAPRGFSQFMAEINKKCELNQK